MTYQEALDWLYSTQQFGIKLGLEAPRRLLREFLAFPAHTTKVVHVAGTNGKGSTCALIDAIARAGGERTGLFTSPHLVSYRERIRVSGFQIPEEEVAKGLTELRELVADWEHHPTFFELTLALGMRYFRQKDCNIIILETGMGGRLDATTAVPADVCVLTPIALDHQKWLGDTLTKIAEEKAAIAVPGKPLITSNQADEALTAIKRSANETRAPLYFASEPLTGYGLNLPGPHQQENAALACDACMHLGLNVSPEIVRYGLARVTWPGRFEQIRPDLILDAAHNPHAAEALVATWQQKFGSEGKNKPTIIFGAAGDKDSAAVIQILEKIAARFLFVPVNSPRSLPPESHQTTLPSQAFPTLPAALDALEKNPAVPNLVTGSIFLLGEVTAHLQNETTTPTAQ